MLYFLRAEELAQNDEAVRAKLLDLTWRDVYHGSSSHRSLVVPLFPGFAVDVLPHARDHHRSFADRGRNPLDRAGTHVAHRENTGPRAGKRRGRAVDSR